MPDPNMLQGNEWTPQRVSSVSKIAALVLAGGICLGIFTTTVNIYYVAAGIAAAGLAILVAWKFEAALLLYLLFAFIPWGKTPDIAVGGSGAGKGLYLSEIMLGFLLTIWWAKYMLGNLPASRIKNGFTAPIIIYLAYSLINIIHSFIFWDSHVSRIYQYPQVNAIELALRVMSAGAFAMMASSISSSIWLRRATLLLMVPGLYNLINAMLGSPVPIASPWWPLVALLPVGYCWSVALDAGKSPFMRMTCALLVAAAIGVIFVSSLQWVSGWLGLFSCLATITFFKSRKIFAVAMIFVLIAATIFWPFLQQNVLSTSVEEGDFDRFSLLMGAMKYATNFPLGVGLGNYRTYNSFYYGNKWGTTSYTSAHGTYAQHLSEMGVPGLILLLCILVLGFRWLRRSYLAIENSFSKTFLIAVMGQLVGLSCAAFIGDYIIPTYHNGGVVTFSATVYLWLACGLAVSHVRFSRGQSDGPIHFDSELEHAGSARSVH